MDYRLNRFASVGFMPELTLNVIPKVDDYPVSAMISGPVRLKAQYPDCQLGDGQDRVLTHLGRVSAIFQHPGPMSDTVDAVLG